MGRPQNQRSSNPRGSEADPELHSGAQHDAAARRRDLRRPLLIVVSALQRVDLAPAVAKAASRGSSLVCRVHAQPQRT